MKKKLSLILAFLMAASMTMAGCKKTDDTSSGMPDTQTSLPTITRMTTTTTEETTTTTAETTETETTTETTAETTAETTETTAATVTAASEKTWTETEKEQTLYVTTDCYSRKQAIVGSEAVKKYSAGTKINVVATTHTGYYKLADGTFIHSDYVSDKEPSATTTAAPTTTAKPAATTEKTSSATTAPKPAETTPANTQPAPSSPSARSYTDKYPYKQLDKNGQQLYANIVEAAENFQRSVTVPSGMSLEDILRVYLIVFNNEPQLFWLETSVVPSTGTMNLDYALSKESAETAKKNIEANAKAVINKVNACSSTRDKLMVIHDWVITNNGFDEANSFGTCGIYNSLNNGGKLQCQGYAKTVQYLCDLAGIDSMVVIGENNAAHSHAWNVVYCSDGYYILDTTWDDPISDNFKAGFVRYLYFLTNDQMTTNSHLKINKVSFNGKTLTLYTPPACTKTTYSYFKTSGREYSDLASAEQGIYAALDEAISSKKQAAVIKVTNHDLWETLRTDEYAVKFLSHALSKDKNLKLSKSTDEKLESILVIEYDIGYKQ